MKFKYILFLAFCISLSITNVHASSIEYNLTIDDNMNFTENNIYKIKESEMVKTGNYDFMTSVVKDKIYYNEDKKVSYTKTKTKSNGVYTVKLHHEYSPLFINDSRILQECFSKYDLENESSYVKIHASSPFYCSSRADSIKVNIITKLEVISNNADEHNGNVYTWYPKTNSFELEFGVKATTTENSEPMDNVGNDTDTDSTQDNNQNTPQDSNKPTDTQTNDTNNQKNSNPLTGIIIATIVLALSIVIIITVIILKIKKNQINKI